ncbi:MAG: DUF3536 domain-containing protein [Myxococcota bacterium]
MQAPSGSDDFRTPTCFTHRVDGDVIVHGHFYQPPRENPWTGAVDREPSAAPFHDWNARVFRDAYRANAHARILDDSGRVIQVVNNYETMSFNFGPTLLSWMEAHHPITYGRILEADRKSVRERGFGNALAQAFNHTILPLDDPRDLRTQILWGLNDFESRFGRVAEGMWLPETAANEAVLSALAKAGVRFTVLAPSQAQRIRPLGTTEWASVTQDLDQSRPYRWLDPDASGRHLDLFFFDAGRSKAVAFDRALNTSQAFAELFSPGQLRILATDGESYGHHSVFGDRTLAHFFRAEGPRRGLSFTNFASVRHHQPPTHEVELAAGPNGEGTAWSCAHGIGRWTRDCGCSTGGGPGAHQRWRAPLRTALEGLREVLHQTFEEMGGELFLDPWAARDDYQPVIGEGPEAFEAWSQGRTRRDLSADDGVRARRLLEMERNVLLMFTSCGWFFHDVSGIETVQILKYAGRAIDHAVDLGLPSPEPKLLEALAEAPSYIPEQGTGADVYRKAVGRARVTPARAAAHLAVDGLVEAPTGAGEFAGFAFRMGPFQVRRSGPYATAAAWMELVCERTDARHQIGVAALHLGGIDVYGTVSPSMSQEAFEKAASRIFEDVEESSLPTLIRRLQAHFGPEEFQLSDLLPEQAEGLAQLAFGELLERFGDAYAQLYRDHGRTLDMLQAAGFQLPKELKAAAEFTLQRRFQAEIEDQAQSRDPQAYHRAIEIARQAESAGYALDRRTSAHIFEGLLNRAVQEAMRDKDPSSVEAVRKLVELVGQLALEVSMDQAQEMVLGLYGETTDPATRSALMTLLRLTPSAFQAGPSSVTRR